ncbi:CHAP domain-containing protein [Novosphingobium sp. CF614]|uniref:CHAP domain-containing protein n=1 Tax=Novosphingobium sp. CF614 TaxID=1884364 RepID=UPI002100C32E|nr:CHAP domain-containing protein [Novosphingobium sp. CF614]
MLVPSVAASSAIGRIASDTVPGGWNPGTGVSGTGRASGVLECVPYARQLSGIHIYGDAHTWWSQAKGRYARGHMPRVGAVMAVEPHNNSRLGHVATVSRIVDSRTILLSHANWSYRGQIERNVTALDVSPGNDWSEVRIWYGPNRNLGTTHWPVAGFIYNARPGTLRDLGPDLGGNRLAQISAPTKAGTKRQQRRRDPIGEIIAGTY